MHRLLPAFAILAAVVGSVTPSQGAYITESGRAGCAIVLPNDATPGEKCAARELRDHIRQITGVELRQISERLYSAMSGSCISVGRTALSARYVNDEQMQAFGDDGYRVFAENGNLFFVGGRRRGSMYAVYEYLESLGVRWWSPDCTVIPKMASLPMPSKSFGHTPQLWYRDQWWNDGTTNEWLARMRVNGSNGQDHFLPETLGGSTVTMQGCHSYAELVPPAENFDKHPEWFALKPDGNRSPHELCLVNPELRKFVVQRVLADLRARAPQKLGSELNSDPNFCGVDNYWVSQNDGGGDACHCGKCTAEREAHGGKDAWSANTVAFVSYVADRVKPEFPKVRIKTLAYNYTKEAPIDIKASDGMVVEICGNFGPGDDPHSKLVGAWSKVAKNISVYTYGGSNYGYWWPCPNAWEVGMQYPWALKNGVKAFYVQGTALGRGSGLVDLKAYLSARMAWDPSRDVHAEIRDFCEGFYGPGGKYVLEYLEWYPSYIKEHNLVMDAHKIWGDSEAWRKWVTKESMDHCDALFRKALAATEDNPTYLKHVRQAYLEVLWGSIAINLQPGSDLMHSELKLVPGADEADVRARAKLFGEIMRENGYDKWREDLAFEADKYPH